MGEILLVTALTFCGIIVLISGVLAVYLHISSYICATLNIIFNFDKQHSIYMRKNLRYIAIVFLLWLQANVLHAQAAWTICGKIEANSSILTLNADRWGNVYAAGRFKDSVLPKGHYFVAKWDGFSWSELGIGGNALNADSTINLVTTDDLGNVYATGYFTNDSNKAYIAMWNGSSWSELSSGTNSLPIASLQNYNQINALATSPSGKVYASFVIYDSLNSYTGYKIYEWYHASWHDIGSSSDRFLWGDVRALATDWMGNLYVTGSFKNLLGRYYIAKWNDTTWSELGSSSDSIIGDLFNSSISVDDSAHVYINNETEIMKWDGNMWTTLSNKYHAHNGISSVTVDKSGNIYAAQFDDSINTMPHTNGKPYISEWKDTGWNELSNGEVNLHFSPIISQNEDHTLQIVTDVYGNLYACGSLIDPVNQHYIAVYPATNIKEPPANSNYRIYPNPADNSLNIQLDKLYIDAEVHITDVTGRKIYTAQLNSINTTIDVSHWLDGLYICNVSLDGVINTVKLLVKH